MRRLASSARRLWILEGWEAEDMAPLLWKGNLATGTTKLKIGAGN